MASASSVSYEQKKVLAEELKELTKDQYEEIYRIVKRAGIPYSENSNGIFFDLASMDGSVASQLIEYMNLVKAQRNEEKQRMKDLEYYRHEKETE
jgi:hypothetical protein